MDPMMTTLRRLLLTRDERGAVSTEYVVLMGAVGLGVVFALVAIGPTLVKDFQSTRTVIAAPHPVVTTQQGETTMDKLTLAKKDFLKDTRGANLVEYIILVGVVALIALAGFKIFGQKVNSKINDQASTVGGI